MSVPAEERCERVPTIASKSIVGSLYLVKLDNLNGCGHTQITMIRSALALESRTPLRAGTSLATRLLVPGLVILTVIVILPL